MAYLARKRGDRNSFATGRMGRRIKGLAEMGGKPRARVQGEDNQGLGCKQRTECCGGGFPAQLPAAAEPPGAVPHALGQPAPQLVERLRVTQSLHPLLTFGTSIHLHRISKSRTDVCYTFEKRVTTACLPGHLYSAHAVGTGNPFEEQVRQ